MKESRLPDGFAARLKWAREKKEWTQQQLADAIGVSQSTIGNLEAGSRGSARKLAMIANVLEVDAYWLETGEGSPQGQPVDELLAQVSGLTPAERSVVAAVIAGLRGVLVGARQPDPQGVADTDLTGYEKRMLDLLRQLDDQGRRVALTDLQESVRSALARNARPGNVRQIKNIDGN